MSKKRLYELRHELGVESKEIVKVAKELGMEVTTASSGVTEDEEKEIIDYFNPPKNSIKVSKEKKNSKIKRKENSIVEEDISDIPDIFDEEDLEEKKELIIPKTENIGSKKLDSLKKKNFVSKKKLSRPRRDKKSKVIKEKKIKKISQRRANMMFALLILSLLGGSFVLGKSIGEGATKLASASVMREDSKGYKQNNDSSFSNLMTYDEIEYVEGFVKDYFTFSSNPEEQKKQAEKLSKYYVKMPEVLSQGQTKLPTELISQKLVGYKDGVATYDVKYKVTNEKMVNYVPTGQKDSKGNNKVEKVVAVEEISTAFNVPFKRNDTGIYISALPSFSNQSSNQATKVENELKLSENTSDVTEEVKKNLDKNINEFFKAYTTDDKVLPLMANVKALTILKFKSLDYSYYIQEKDNVKAYVQVTFEDKGGNTHSENFSLLMVKKGNSLFIEEMNNGIPNEYADKNDIAERGK